MTAMTSDHDGRTKLEASTFMMCAGYNVPLAWLAARDTDPELDHNRILPPTICA
jgi:hypothetical protein